MNQLQLTQILHIARDTGWAKGISLKEAITASHYAELRANLNPQGLDILHSA